MTRPWTVLATAPTPDGTLALRSRSERDVLITLDGRVLMNAMAHRSEEALGALACEGLKSREHPRVLVGGLGMAFTLRAVLDALPASAEVVVVELNPVMVEWCRGPLVALTLGAVDDPRVEVVIGDVAEALRDAPRGQYDAIVIDLFVGPDARTRRDDRLYGDRAAARAFSALRGGGTLAVWGEAYHPSFAQRLGGHGFEVRHERPGRGGMRHVVYIATKPGDSLSARRRVE